MPSTLEPFDYHHSKALPEMAKMRNRVEESQGGWEAGMNLQPGESFAFRGDDSLEAFTEAIRKRLADAIVHAKWLKRILEGCESPVQAGMSDWRRIVESGPELSGGALQSA